MSGIDVLQFIKGIPNIEQLGCFLFSYGFRWTYSSIDDLIQLVIQHHVFENVHFLIVLC